MSRHSLRRLATIAVLGVLLSVLPLSATPSAQAQIKPDCSDGRALAWAQVANHIWEVTLGRIFGPRGELFGKHNGIAENPNDLWARCVEPHLNPDGDGADSDGRRSARGFGDPHLVTLDGGKYSFHGAGDYRLLEAPSRNAFVQGRFERTVDTSPITIIDGIAMRVDGDTIEVYEQQTLLNGEVIDTWPSATPAFYDFDSGWMYRNPGGRPVFWFDNGLAVQVWRAHVTVSTPIAWDGEVSGLLGNANGDPLDDVSLDDGTIVDVTDVDTLYGAYLDAMFVDPADSFFVDPFDFDDAGPKIPQQVFTLADFDDTTIAAAIATCEAAGVGADHRGFDECVFDVAFTGDPEWAEGGRYNHFGSPEVSLVAVGAEVEQRFDVAAEGRIDASDQAEQPGNLGGQGTADVISIAASDLDSRWVQATEPCADDLAPTFSVLEGEQVRSEFALTCGSRRELPTGAVDVRVTDTTGRNPTYAFSWGPAGTTDLGAIEIDRTYEGSIGRGDIVIGTLDVSPGAAVFVDRAAGTECYVRIELWSAEELVAAVPSCTDGEPIVLDGPGPFELRAHTTLDLTDFGFTVRLPTNDGPSTALETTAEGTEVRFEIDEPGATASYAIPFEAGDRVYVEVIGSFDGGSGELRLIAPGGAVVAEAAFFQDLGPHEALVDGSYILEFDADGDHVGVHIVEVTAVADDTDRVAGLDTEIPLTISTPGQIASAVVDLQAGQRIYVERRGSLDSPGTVELRRPDGTVAANAPTFRDVGPWTVDVDGPHTLALSGNNAAVGTIDLIVHRVADDTVTDVSVGDEVVLTIATPGQTDGIAVDLGAGDRVYVEMLERPENGTGWVLASDPTGAGVSTATFLNPGLLVAEVAGRHTFTFGADDALTGSIRLKIHASAPDTSVPVTDGAQFELDVATAGQTAAATIDLEAGSELRIDFLDATIERAEVRVIGPDGEVTGSGPTFLDGIDVAIVQSGEHRIELAGSYAEVGSQGLAISVG